MDKIKSLVLNISLPVGVFILTKNPLTGPFKLQMLLASILILGFYWFILSKGKTPALSSPKFTYILITLSLFLVGATGWFFSPFFFVLYLLGIALSLMYSPVVSVGFIVTLVALFSFNVGEVDLTYDFLIVLSLLSTIPVGLFLHREYLSLKESAKEILVLQHEHQKYKDELEEVLANTVNNFAVNLRQPINDTKQLAFRLAKAKNKEEEDKDRDRIIASAEEALRMLKNFEESSTGKKLLTSQSVIRKP